MPKLYGILFYFIIYSVHKNRIKHADDKKNILIVGEPPGNNRDIAIKTRYIFLFV